MGVVGKLKWSLVFMLVEIVFVLGLGVVFVWLAWNELTAWRLVWLILAVWVGWEVVFFGKKAIRIYKALKSPYLYLLAVKEDLKGEDEDGI